MKVLVLGANGMLGQSAVRRLSEVPGLVVHATVRSESARESVPPDLRSRVVTGVDATDFDSVVAAFGVVRPDVVVNCVGLVKQLRDANDPLRAIPLNALFPHRLAALASATGTRVVHVSTDCVFRGDRGGYVEDDLPDAYDLYGRSKLLGEIVDKPHCITLRTSIVGHDRGGSTQGLVEWFLSQRGSVRGFTKAIFSGLTTDELCDVIARHVLPTPSLHGLFHVASAPIAKFDLLRLVSEVYGRDVVIVPDDALVLDRSLDATRFRALTGYEAPSWDAMIRRMRALREEP